MRASFSGKAGDFQLDSVGAPIRTKIEEAQPVDHGHGEVLPLAARKRDLARPFDLLHIPADHIQGSFVVETDAALRVENGDAVLQEKQDERVIPIGLEIEHVVLGNAVGLRRFLHDLPADSRKFVPRAQLVDVNPKLLAKIAAVNKHHRMNIVGQRKHMPARRPFRKTIRDKLIAQAAGFNLVGQIDETDVLNRAPGKESDGAVHQLHHVRHIRAHLQRRLKPALKRVLVGQLDLHVTVVFLVKSLNGRPIYVRLLGNKRRQHKVGFLITIVAGDRRPKCQANARSQSNDQNRQRSGAEGEFHGASRGSVRHSVLTLNRGIV
jgi:hypothetical protein